MEIRTIGIDLGKTVFHLVGVNARGEVVVRKKCSRTQLLRFTSNVPECLIGMEACAGSHFLGRALREQGHDARLMPAQYVKPYVKTNKNDFIDAEACAEAVTRPTMRFVPIKTDEQLDLQSLHRVRERWVMRRTAVINQIRGMLLERGITVRKGRRYIEESLPSILEDPDNKLSGALRALLRELRLEMQYLHRQIEESDKLIVRIAGELEDCNRLVAVPGIGPTIATATIAAIGNGAAFKKVEDLPLGWAWFQENTPPEASKCSPGPAGVETNTCANFSCKGHMRCCNAGPSKILPSVPGWGDWRRASELK
jgi:transposase